MRFKTAISVYDAKADSEANVVEEIEVEDDVKAISALLTALRPLDAQSRVYVIEFVLKKFGIELTGQYAGEAHVSPPPAPGAASVAPPTHQNLPGLRDIRTFAAEKKPKTVNERVAVIGYYLAQLAPESERRDYLVSDDIKTYFIQAGFELPSAPASMTLIHAKNAGYLNALDRGQYKLNAVGHNLVAHKLPNSEANDSRRRTPPRKIPKKAKARKVRK